MRQFLGENRICELKRIFRVYSSYAAGKTSCLWCLRQCWLVRDCSQNHTKWHTGFRPWCRAWRNLRECSHVCLTISLLACLLLYSGNVNAHTDRTCYRTRWQWGVVRRKASPARQWNWRHRGWCRGGRSAAVLRASWRIRRLSLRSLQACPTLLRLSEFRRALLVTFRFNAKSCEAPAAVRK